MSAELKAVSTPLLDGHQDDNAFEGYRWSYFSSLQEGSPLQQRAQSFLDSVNWDRLLTYAASLRNHPSCILLPEIGLGYNHMVRIVEFPDKVRWLARLRLSSVSPSANISEHSQMECEYYTIRLVQEASEIPVPRIHDFMNCSVSQIGADLMLMDCLRGNAGIDLNMDIPLHHKGSVLSRMAEIHSEISRILLPQIGTISGINDDGTYRQGPIPGLGGPFDTAADFYKAWASKVEFGLSADQLKEATGQFADEISVAIIDFKKMLYEKSASLSIRNEGPFPLCHGDFGHNNMIFSDNYHILGVIDWEGAFAAPWEISGEFPLTLSIVPPAMDVPWNYDAHGLPKDPQSRQKLADREEYIALVEEKEREAVLPRGHKLSSALRDSDRQYLATAMSLFQIGKPGWYSKVLGS
ncbi:hypothetical protein P170DRAFT_364182 [Aspergillus steynii IBT 23096]|uniref:Aminoglycoside phosphotransferase domain-containing protein n=1 Tax=Aspergillus steynii IBT 23096 TaxID=1392250 RepID=A0A2I2FYS1_9EURO|nr:uncharacterized protein P170DRAFT_364182 [Aspergillus steynii IBT 23096]PLB45783.1 hypothetical protein P170DRAFT_364182 [Aspergillus steynii IBT 23096]